MIDWTTTEIVRAVRTGETSAEEVCSTFVTRVEASSSVQHSWVALRAEAALAEARDIDRARAAGTPLRALAGVPFGVKDIFNTKDLPTEMGSPIWKGFTPGNDARVVFDLRQQSAIVLGKTATAEFAVNQLGDTLNPFDAARTPGTSSSGSAAAVANGEVPFALATQTAGSIIRPSSYCGVYGFKPSFGLLPRTAVLKTTDSLDTVGFMARGALDLRLIFDVARVKGPNFPISHAALSDAGRQTRPVGHRWRVLVARPHTWANVLPSTRDAFEAELQRWSATGLVELQERPLPALAAEAHRIHAIIYERTLAYYFAEEAKKHQLISPVLNAMIERGRTTTLDQYKAALKQQVELAAALDHFLVDFDVLATPSVAGEAPPRHAPEPEDSCLLWTTCGLPSINVPSLVGPSGLPVGIQIAARKYDDYLLLGFLEELVARELAPRASRLAERR